METRRPSESTMTYGMLASGNLGLVCLKFVHQHRPLNFVFTNKSSKTIVAYCGEHSIPHFVGNPRHGAASDFLDSFQTDVVLSTNYLFMVKDDVLSHPQRFAINFHGSLLPKYRGRAPHIWAIINDEKETGVTAHLMDSGCDTGDIVLQRRIAIEPFDSGAEILNQYKALYPEMIENVIQLIESNEIRPEPQDHLQATCFPKRTPSDGAIDWSWQYNRIHNWVRALRYPYPGAFTICDGQQIIVQIVRRSTVEFDSDTPDGTVLTRSPLVLKTADCAVEIVDYSCSSNIKTGTILGYPLAVSQTSQ